METYDIGLFKHITTVQTRRWSDGELIVAGVRKVYYVTNLWLLSHLSNIPSKLPMI